MLVCKECKLENNGTVTRTKPMQKTIFELLKKFLAQRKNMVIPHHILLYCLGILSVSSFYLTMKLDI